VITQFSPHSRPNTLVSAHQTLFGNLAGGLCRGHHTRGGKKIVNFQLCSLLWAARCSGIDIAAACCWLDSVA